MRFNILIFLIPLQTITNNKTIAYEKVVLIISFFDVCDCV
jgi:hypothetical protein